MDRAVVVVTIPNFFFEDLSEETHERRQPGQSVSRLRFEPDNSIFKTLCRMSQLTR